MKTPEPLMPKAKTIAELLEQICQATKDGNYIFRGEPRKNHDIEGDEIEQNSPVSSNLYRQFEKAAEVDSFNIGNVQRLILKSAREHIKEEKTDDEILEELQHYGGKTNQIDFATEYEVALLFACEGEPQRDGRLIFLDKEKSEALGIIHKPKNPPHRVEAQKSIFVRPPLGVVEVDKIIVIDKELKIPVLSYLDKHSIAPKSIYNDIHGFIDRSRNHEGGYTNLHLGLAYYDDEKYEKAIEYYKEALKYDSGLVAFIHNNLGTAYVKLGATYKEETSERTTAFTQAIAYYTKAIEQNTNYIKAYYSRGLVYYLIGKNDLVIEDSNKVIKLNPNHINAHYCYGIAKAALHDHEEARKYLGIALKLAKEQGEEDIADFIQKVIDLQKAINNLPPH